MMKSSRPILLVEDDEVDAMTVQRALRDIKVSNQLVVKENGEDALNYLNEEGNGKSPCIILLDLNMPKMNGIEFLKERKSEKSLDKIPVVVLTTSKDEEDKVDSFKLGVAGYMVKPVDYQKFVEVMRTIDIYWTLSEVPFSH